jgi:hypothetical protein
MPSIIAALSICLAQTAHAAVDDIYVDANHGGPYEGTSGNPYQTITDALGAAGPNDTIYVKGGTSPVRYYTSGLGEVFPLEPAFGVSIIGSETSRAAWPRIGGDVAGEADALLLVEANVLNEDRSAGTVSRLMFLGEDEANEDSPVALKVVATGGSPRALTSWITPARDLI